MKEICLIVNDKEANKLYEYLEDIAMCDDWDIKGNVRVYKPEQVKK